MVLSVIRLGLNRIPAEPGQLHNNDGLRIMRRVPVSEAGYGEEYQPRCGRGQLRARNQPELPSTARVKR